MNKLERQNQINQELEAFLCSELYQEFLRDQKLQRDLAVKTILEGQVTSLQSFIQREQNIGAAKEIEARLTYFDDLRHNQLAK